MALAVRRGIVLRASPCRGEGSVLGLLPRVDVAIRVQLLLRSTFAGDKLREGRHVENAMASYLFSSIYIFCVGNTLTADQSSHMLLWGLL